MIQSERRSYALVVCEKPDAARRVSDALSDGKAEAFTVEGATAFRFRVGPEEFVVCSAQGHLYTLSDPVGERVVYPAFDVEWYGSGVLEDKNLIAARRITAIKKLAARASRFINACDFDVEGETIGFNILRYACGGKEKEASRAKFSTLTREELVQAFRSARPQAGDGLARAGRARHMVDFIWGVNLSRILSQSALAFGHRYRTVSVGRVQGPTLDFLVQRERDIRGFVPVPYWCVVGVFEKDGVKFRARYVTDKVGKMADAYAVKEECTGKDGTITSVLKRAVMVPPPPPLNIGDLQKEAYRAFGYLPTRTLQAAEKLYLAALISYPRTGSQKLPPTIGYQHIMKGLAGLPKYADLAAKLLRGAMKPVQGSQIDPAHPAIHPTGEPPRRPLDSAESSVFDLVARRFMAAFAPPTRREFTLVEMTVGRHKFLIDGARTTFPGWMDYYWRAAGPGNAELPTVAEGDRIRLDIVETEERFSARPVRYNQGSLLEKMEKERIGTKATRAEVISTLVGRGYATGENLAVSDLGLSVVETMEKYAPSIVTIDLTRKIEERLEAIERGEEDGRELLRETVRTVSEQLTLLNSNELKVGKEIDASLMATVAASYVLGPCPVCKTGRLTVVRSKKTKKRFVGCTNYAGGCRASAPLPQKGALRPSPTPCRHCSWPVVYVLGGRTPWRLCVNLSCPSKVSRTHEV